MLAQLLPFQSNRRVTHDLYHSAVIQAREPAFYKDMAVPDSLDGRFDMIMLHVILIVHALKKTEGKKGERKRSKKLAQGLFDTMFKDMDKALREMGIGDLSVPKHMKRMMNAFNGRMQHYDDAFDGILAGNKELKLGDVLKRNIYADDENVDLTGVQKLCAYITLAVLDLSHYPVQKISDGSIIYPVVKK